MIKMSRKKEKPSLEKPELEYVCPSASWGDMTGLIPSGGADEQERSSYQEIFPYLPEAEKGRNQKRDSL